MGSQVLHEMCILSELALADGTRVPKLISGSKGTVLQSKVLQQTSERLEETAADVAAVVSSLFVHLLVLHQALDTLQSTAAYRTWPTLILAAFALLHCCSTSVAH